MPKTSIAKADAMPAIFMAVCLGYFCINKSVAMAKATTEINAIKILTRFQARIELETNIAKRLENPPIDPISTRPKAKAANT